MATTTIEISSASITATGFGVQVMPIVADPISYTLTPYAGAHAPGLGLNVDHDLVWDTYLTSNDGIINFDLSPNGEILSTTITEAVISYTRLFNADVLAGLVANGPITYTRDLNADWYRISNKENWVSWSKIGDASFVIDRYNEAGSRPMDWKGWAWKVLQLDKFAVVYGSGGITIMYPVEAPAATFGFKNISKVGIKSAYSVAGDQYVHYFITEKDELWRMTQEGPEMLGFQEFLSGLTNPVLIYDKYEKRLFISDGTTGYVFKDGLGGGYATITGVTKSEYASPDGLAGTPISIMTDTLDLGHRGIKQITFIEIGTYATEDLFVALDYRYTKSENWRTSDWVKTNPEGVARLMIAAIEFRVRLKQTTFEEIQIDYINLRHQRPDKRFLRGPLHEIGDQGD